ncbi:MULTISPECIES: monovalent cation/H(+) antiporter subunit G [unclassified Micromonospora]|uniref:monovalent cation/H(+) antiporter subunit G n=1 Tax=unclassified Micromonospora TaxID=2617518 RepID=UPI0010472686|nr:MULTISPECIES: monovalent cation/H(+) antiporter subunit G [unclassified Micromonospora]TDB74775.1 monovalent cation/H(+) antiporter subunit G [Micromonospora sp. KC721]TDC37511.1 monovalent cation/H(+) antiporter subunit G [Micromonospora sp. KC213]
MTLDAVLDIVAAGCLIAGALLSLAAGVALIRFPDLLSRMHAAAKPQVLGLLLVLLGCALRLRTGVDITTLVLVGVFQLATAPVAAHMVGRVAYPHDEIRRDLLLTDELAAHIDRIRADRTDRPEVSDAASAPGRG